MVYFSTKSTQCSWTTETYSDWISLLLTINVQSLQIKHESHFILFSVPLPTFENMKPTKILKCHAQCKALVKSHLILTILKSNQIKPASWPCSPNLFKCSHHTATLVDCSRRQWQEILHFFLPSPSLFITANSNTQLGHNWNTPFK